MEDKILAFGVTENGSNVAVFLFEFFSYLLVKRCSCSAAFQEVLNGFWFMAGGTDSRVVFFVYFQVGI